MGWWKEHLISERESAQDRSKNTVPCNYLQHIAANALYPSLLGAGLIGALVVAGQGLSFDSTDAFFESTRKAEQWLVYWTVLYLIGPTMLLHLRKPGRYSGTALTWDALEVVALFVVLSAGGAFPGFKPDLWIGYGGILGMVLFAAMSRRTVKLPTRSIASLVVTVGGISGAILAVTAERWLIFSNLLLFGLVIHYLAVTVRLEWEECDHC